MVIALLLVRVVLLLIASSLALASLRSVTFASAVLLPIALSASASVAREMSSVNDRLQAALRLHKNGMLDEAVSAYKSLLPLVPLQAQVSLYGNLGAIFMGQGLFTDAKEQFLAAVDVAPTHASSQFNLAVLLTSKLNEHAKALKHCALAIRADPKAHKAFHLMGNILQNLGKHKEAEKYFEQAEALAQDGLQPSAASAARSPSPLAGAIDYGVEVGDIIQYSIEGKTYDMKCISTEPLIFVIDDFLTTVDCDEIRSMADAGLEKSFVMGGEVADARNMYNVKDAPSSAGELGEEDPRLYRSSYTAWVSRNAVLERLQKRLSQVLQLPLAYIQHKSEDLQVVKYNMGGQFKVHQDSSHFHPRLLTALVYLHTVGDIVGAEGGETWFPFSQAASDHSEALTPPSTVEEAVVRALEVYQSAPVDRLPGLAVQPQKGRAVIFFNYNLVSGELDPLAVHSGLPVRRRAGEADSISGGGTAEKWIANYWVESDPALLRELLGRGE